MKTIIIKLQHGSIQEVLNPYKDIQIIIKDYDVDGLEDDIKEDFNGNEYIEEVW